MKTLAAAMGLALAAIGLVGILAPSVLIDFARSIQTQTGVYAATAVRVFFGLVLFWAASGSRMPKTLRVIGIVMILAGLVGLFAGAERLQAIADWASAQPAWFMRLWAALPVVLGAFITYAVAIPRRHIG